MTCKNAGNISKNFGENLYACLRQGCKTDKIPSLEMCPGVHFKQTQNFDGHAYVPLCVF